MSILQRIVDTISGVLFLVMFLLFIAAILFRYVFDNPLSWSMELIMVSFLVMLFFTGALGLPAQRHISFNILYSAMPPNGKRVFAITGNVIGIIVLAVATPGAFEISLFEGRSSTPILHIPFSVFYFTFLLFVVSFAVRLLLGIVRLFGANWRDRV